MLIAREDPFCFNGISKIGRQIFVLNHDLLLVEVVIFFWDEDYGWCFAWFDNETERNQDCLSYGIINKDFIPLNDINEKDINAFLNTQEKDENEEIPVNLFFDWLDTYI